MEGDGWLWRGSEWVGEETQLEWKEGRDGGTRLGNVVKDKGWKG